MVLKDRPYGYQQAEIEKILLYERSDIGFVRPASKDPRIFYLDPSPFLRTNKEEIYIALSCPPPTKGDLVEVTVADIEEEILSENIGTNLFRTFYKKTISNWKSIDPNSLAKGSKLLKPDDVLGYFKIPYLGGSRDLQGVALCSALSWLACPPLMSGVGGMNTAVFGKAPSWKANVRRLNSPYYYKISSDDDSFTTPGSIEVNFVCHHPKVTVIHTPITIGCETKYTSWYQNELESTAPLMTSFLIDSLLFRPVLSPNIENKIVEKVYDLQRLLSTKKVPCKIDIGTCLPRIALAMSRLYSRTETSADDIDNAFNLFEDMVDQTNALFNTKYSRPGWFKRESTDRNLYIFIAKEFGTDRWIPEIEIIARLGDIPMTSEQYTDSFNRLNYEGMIIRDGKKEIRLLEPTDDIA
jgi:hypothetical protein